VGPPTAARPTLGTRRLGRTSVGDGAIAAVSRCVARKKKPTTNIRHQQPIGPRELAEAHGGGPVDPDRGRRTTGRWRGIGAAEHG